MPGKQATNKKPRVLWVDLTVAIRHAEMPPLFAETCDVIPCPHPAEISGDMTRHSPHGICFDFDYPDHVGLDILRKTKAKYSQVPVLMLTLQHSEDIAVWAFRARVIDYLIKPVSRSDFTRGIKVFRAAAQRSRAQSPRSMLDNNAPIPPEVSMGARTDDLKLLPALYYIKQNFRYKVRSSVVAEQCNMSPFRFSRAFKETYGLTFQDYILRYRIYESARLLRNPFACVSDVAYAIGFNDASYFSRIFKRYIGISPSAYVANAKADTLPDEKGAALLASLNLPDEVLPMRTRPTN